MKRNTILGALVVLMLSASVSLADVHVRGHYRSSGTYVQPHYRSNPDGNSSNNWSTYPNVNPRTGSMGTRHAPSDSWSTPTYRPSRNSSINTLPYRSSRLGSSGYRSYGY
jgi:hypothetical protein